MQEQLAIRIDAENPNHHLWKNHETWWIHYTLSLDSLRARRVRRSLRTKDVGEARRLRDAFLGRPGPVFVGGDVGGDVALDGGTVEQGGQR